MPVRNQMHEMILELLLSLMQSGAYFHPGSDKSEIGNEDVTHKWYQHGVSHALCGLKYKSHKRRENCSPDDCHYDKRPAQLCVWT